MCATNHSTPSLASLIPRPSPGFILQLLWDDCPREVTAPNLVPLAVLSSGHSQIVSSSCICNCGINLRVPWERLPLALFHSLCCPVFDHLHVQYAKTEGEGLGRICLVASSPGHSHILPCSHGEKLREGLGSLLHHGPELGDICPPLELMNTS